MWKLIDTARRRRRLSELEFRESVYNAALGREKAEQWRPSALEASHGTIGGERGRSMLISWVLDEAVHQRLNPSTACLAVNYLDRTLACNRVPLNTAQNLAAVCLQLAIKMDAIGGDAMEVPAFSDWTPNSDLELFALRSLEWKLIVPTPYTFLSMYGEQFWLPAASRNRAYHYLKHILLYVVSQTFYPSTLALVCILLLERDELLPSPCKALAMECIKDGRVCAAAVTNAFRIFRNRCPQATPQDGSEQGTWSIDDDSASGSSTTAYPDSANTSGTSEPWDSV